MTGRSHKRGSASRLTAATGSGWRPEPMAVLPIADRNLPEWLRPSDGDTLFGIEAIARYLGLPFLDVRTMIELRRLPTRKAGSSHTARRSDIAQHILGLEAATIADVAAPPADLTPDGALGLLSGQPAIAAYLGCTVSGVRHRREKQGLGVFWVGKTPFARRDTLDRWATARTTAAVGQRRNEASHSRRRAAAPPGALVGAGEIAAFLGRSIASTHMLIYRAAIPVARVGGGIVGDRAALAPYVLPTRLERELWGAKAIARFLAVPEVTAARMLAEVQIPAERRGVRWIGDREAIARHILAAERGAVDAHAAPAPTALTDGALGIVLGQAAVGEAIGRSRRGVEYLRRVAGLPVFFLGTKAFARRASLEQWALGQPTDTPEVRRVATRRATIARQAKPGAIIGASVIGEAQGISASAVKKAIRRGQLRAHRAGPIWAADRRSINAYRKERGHGQR